MKTFAIALGALALAATAAQAEPVTRSTITGYAASAAVARGIPLDGSVRPANHEATQFRQSAVQYTAAKRTVRTNVD